MSIQFISRNKLDLDKWQMLSNSQGNQLIYNQWWYIDSMTDSRWGALVVDNYRMALPLPFRSKMGLPYVYQPFITQRFTLFGETNNTEHSISSIISAIPSKFMVVNLSIGNKIETYGRFRVTERTNHILDLNREYEQLAENYNRNTRRNLLAATRRGLAIDFNHKLDDFLQHQIAWEPFPFTIPHKTRILNLWQSMKIYADPFVVTVYLGTNPVAVGLFCVYGGRVYFLLCASSKEGKECRAMYWLIDNIFRRFAMCPFVFDFTGSSIPDIARRNTGFGAADETFYSIERVGLIGKLRNLLVTWKTIG